MYNSFSPVVKNDLVLESCLKDFVALFGLCALFAEWMKFSDYYVFSDFGRCDSDLQHDTYYSFSPLMFISFHW